MTMSAKKATCEGIKGDPKFIELLKLRIWIKIIKNTIQIKY
jgi:hypothetical protein